MKRKNKKTALIGVLLVALLFMGAGFAYLSTTLTITGTNTSSGQWDVKIESIEVVDVVGMAESRRVEKSHDGLSANFVVDLYDPGDYVEYKVTVKNGGNIGARLDAADTTVTNSNPHIYMTNTAVLNEVLPANSTTTFNVKIGVDQTEEELTDSTGTKYVLTLNYIQDDNNPIKE